MDVQALLILILLAFASGTIVGYGIRAHISKQRRARWRF
jgi:hypothetical protein